MRKTRFSLCEKNAHEFIRRLRVDEIHLVCCCINPYGNCNRFVCCFNFGEQNKKKMISEKQVKEKVKKKK